jgi:uncharacterized alkaline shock family protein YloU
MKAWRFGKLLSDSLEQGCCSFYNRVAKEEQMAGEVVIPGETIIEDDVVASIAGIAAMEVEGVANLGKSSIRRMVAGVFGGAEGRARRGVDVEVGKKEAIIDLQLDITYGFNIPNIVAEVREKVASRLLEIAGLIAKEINVRVVSIEFAEKRPGKVE